MEDYNYAHARARGKVENTIAILKRRFPVLATCLTFEITKCSRVIQCLIAIHNLIIDSNEDLSWL